MQQASTADIPANAQQGLSESEVTERRQRGLGNNVRLDTSRTYGQIVRANLFTFINMVLFSIGVILVLLGLYTDAFLSVGIAFMNVIIGLIQEIRAKRALDQIALLTRPKATAMRGGQQKIIDPSEIVVGDVLLVKAGDQIVVDGKIVDGKLDADESLLTGESDLVSKHAGDPVYSGSFGVNGSAAYVAEKVGVESVASKLTAGARAFRQIKTPLQMDIDLVVRLLLALASALAIVFGLAAIIAQSSLTDIAKTAAVVTGLIPNGLFFMITIAYAMGAVRMAGEGALIQQSNAVESMSNVNVLCLDKTGTLTANRIHLYQTSPFTVSDEEFRRILGIYAASTLSGNRTSEALHESLKQPRLKLVEEVPFSSSLKWSAISFDSAELSGVYVMGAPEMLRPHLQPNSNLSKLVDEWAEGGLRVLLFAYRPEVTALFTSDEKPQLPANLIPMGIVSFNDELRAEAEQTLKGFADNGISLKIISGDNPQTVAALAKQAGLKSDIQVISGPELDKMSDAQFTETAENSTIFGRITPQQKEKLVDTLRAKGHYVAMIGDGVNDVLSLKKAHIGIAMQSGSQATRGVADIILLNDSFAALPPAFSEGQRIINGMLDIMRLFLTRVVYQTLIIVGIAIIGLAFPITPVHMSLLSLFTVGIPTLALAAWSRPGAPRTTFMRDALRFILPAGVTLTLAGMAVYIPYAINATPEMLSVARTVLTTMTTLGGLILILFVEPPTHFWAVFDEVGGDWRPTIMAGALVAVYFILMIVPGLREFFELAVLEPRDWGIIALAVVVWTLILRFIWQTHLFDRFLRLSD